MESNHPSVGLPRPAGFEGLVRFPTSSTAGSGGAASRTVSGSDLHGETPASRIPGALVARDPSAMMRSPAIGIAEERYARGEITAAELDRIRGDLGVAIRKARRCVCSKSATRVARRPARTSSNAGPSCVVSHPAPRTTTRDSRTPTRCLHPVRTRR
jgi:hypothetical protein